ncbi:MAG: 2TM domain-containing protein [Flavobacteriaceae bacterium]|nr:2TM domain-containing protein [Flavobacteriaceae bacterium]
MERDYTEEKKFIKAQKKVNEIKGFYSHLFVTILIIPFLIYINLRFVPDYHWFWFPIIGMSLGLAFHWLGVFGLEKFGLGKDWENKKIEELMREDNDSK